MVAVNKSSCHKSLQCSRGSQVCLVLLGVDGADLAERSLRVKGVSAQKRPWRPADLLTVMEARELHAILATGNVRFGVQKQVCNGSSDGGGWCDNQTYKSRALCSIAWKRGAQMKDIKKDIWRFVAVQEPRHSDHAIPELLPNNRVPLSATRPTGCLLRFVFLEQPHHVRHRQDFASLGVQRRQGGWD